MSERRFHRGTRSLLALSAGSLAISAALAGLGPDCGGKPDSDQTSVTRGVEPPNLSPTYFDINLKPDVNYSWAVNGRYDAQIYKSNGVKFRQALQVLERVGGTQEADLRKFYEALREENGGAEYLIDGEVFAPKIGQQYTIMDAGTNPGIFLRKEPSLTPAGDSFLYHGMVVEITTDAIDVMDGNGNRHEMYGIRVEDDLDYWRQTIPVKATKGEVGFIDERWLGYPVTEPPAK